MYVVIGLGNFGYYIAKTLYDLNQQVLVVDKNKQKVQNAGKICTKAVAADATDKEVIKSLGVNEAKAVIVGLGDDMAASILVTLHLKDLGVKMLVVKVVSEEHERIVKALGAHRIVFPEKDTAIKEGKHLVRPNILDTLFLSEDYGLLEMAPRKEWIGKSLKELKFLKIYKFQVIAIKDAIKDKIEYTPSGNYIIKDSEILVMLGKIENFEKLQKP